MKENVLKNENHKRALASLLAHTGAPTGKGEPSSGATTAQVFETAKEIAKKKGDKAPTRASVRASLTLLKSKGFIDGNELPSSGAGRRRYLWWPLAEQDFGDLADHFKFAFATGEQLRVTREVTFGIKHRPAATVKRKQLNKEVFFEIYRRPPGDVAADKFCDDDDMLVIDAEVAEQLLELLGAALQYKWKLKA